MHIDPVSNQTVPGETGESDHSTLSHEDLVSISGSNTTIICDKENGIWHIV